jgi:hypothetical protein
MTPTFESGASGVANILGSLRNPFFFATLLVAKLCCNHSAISTQQHSDMMHLANESHVFGSRINSSVEAYTYTTILLKLTR